jgi:hypothetical protein
MFINAIIFSQSLVILSNNLKKKYERKMSGFKSWLYENDIVCFVLKGAENLPARGRKTEKNIALAISTKHVHLCRLKITETKQVTAMMILNQIKTVGECAVAAILLISFKTIKL